MDRVLSRLRFRLGLLRVLPGRVAMSTGSGSLFSSGQGGGTGSGSKRHHGDGTGTGKGFQMTREQLDELVVRTAQLASRHDVELREVKTMYRRVTLTTGSKYGTALREVDEKWKKDRDRGATGGASKHVRLTRVLLEMIYDDAKTEESAKTKLREVFGGKQGNEADMGPYVNVMKWRTFQGGKEGIVEFKLVPELGELEGELVRVLREYGGKVKTGPEPRGPAVRKVDDLLEGTWGK